MTTGSPWDAPEGIRGDDAADSLPPRPPGPARHRTARVDGSTPGMRRAISATQSRTGWLLVAAVEADCRKGQGDDARPLGGREEECRRSGGRRRSSTGREPAAIVVNGLGWLAHLGHLSEPQGLEGGSREVSGEKKKRQIFQMCRIDLGTLYRSKPAVKHLVENFSKTTDTAGNADVFSLVETFQGFSRVRPVEVAVAGPSVGIVRPAATEVRSGRAERRRPPGRSAGRGGRRTGREGGLASFGRGLASFRREARGTEKSQPSGPRGRRAGRGEVEGPRLHI